MSKLERGTVWPVLSAALLLTACTGPTPLRVMCCDVSATADDGHTATTERLIAAIRQHHPDVVGVQHVDAAALTQICAALPDYVYAAPKGESVDSGPTDAILYRRQRLGLVDAGHFRLTSADSRSAELRTSHLATWVRLRLNDMPWLEVCVVQACLESGEERAHLELARSLRRLVEAVGTRPVIVLGELAGGHGAYSYRLLTEARGDRAELREVVCHGGSATAARWLPTARTVGHRCILVNRELETAVIAPVSAAPAANEPGVLLADVHLRRWSGYT